MRRPFIGLGWDKVDIPLDELFAEDVIPVPITRPSGRRDISSLFGMFEPQVESILGRERYEDDDGEWVGVSSQIVRSMTPAREKNLAGRIRNVVEYAFWPSSQQGGFRGNLRGPRVGAK